MTYQSPSVAFRQKTPSLLHGKDGKQYRGRHDACPTDITNSWTQMHAYRDGLPSEEGGKLVAEVVAIVCEQVVGFRGVNLPQLIDVILQNVLRNLGVPAQEQQIQGCLAEELVLIKHHTSTAIDLQTRCWGRHLDKHLLKRTACFCSKQSHSWLVIRVTAHLQPWTCMLLPIDA